MRLRLGGNGQEGDLIIDNEHEGNKDLSLHTALQERNYTLILEQAMVRMEALQFVRLHPQLITVVLERDLLELFRKIFPKVLPNFYFFRIAALHGSLGILKEFDRQRPLNPMLDIADIRDLVLRQQFEVLEHLLQRRNFRCINHIPILEYLCLQVPIPIVPFLECLEKNSHILRVLKKSKAEFGVLRLHCAAENREWLLSKLLKDRPVFRWDLILNLYAMDLVKYFGRIILILDKHSGFNLTNCFQYLDKVDDRTTPLFLNMVTSLYSYRGQHHLDEKKFLAIVSHLNDPVVTRFYIAQTPRVFSNDSLFFIMESGNMDIISYVIKTFLHRLSLTDLIYEIIDNEFIDLLDGVVNLKKNRVQCVFQNDPGLLFEKLSIYQWGQKNFPALVLPVTEETVLECLTRSFDRAMIHEILRDPVEHFDAEVAWDWVPQLIQCGLETLELLHATYPQVLWTVRNALVVEASMYNHGDLIEWLLRSFPNDVSAPLTSVWCNLLRFQNLFTIQWIDENAPWFANGLLDWDLLFSSMCKEGKVRSLEFIVEKNPGRYLYEVTQHFRCMIRVEGWIYLPSGDRHRTALEDADCVICLEEESAEIITGCGHTYCKKCMMRWFGIKKTFECAYCKQIVGSCDVIHRS